MPGSLSYLRGHCAPEAPVLDLLYVFIAFIFFLAAAAFTRGCAKL
jgi:hypothetical protein